jgi:ribonucleotide reductase alpha subunit
MTSNIYLRRTIAGEFIVINKYLLDELISVGYWNNEIKNNIIYNKGSVQKLEIPKCLKDKYKIVWEMPMKYLIDLASDRGPYICQSQSMNLWMENPDYNKLTAMHLYSWKKGLKTGIYYLRTKAKATAQQFTIEPTKNNKINNDEEQECLMCNG